MRRRLRAQTELPEEVEPADWKIVEGRPKRGSWLQKVALMVKGTDEKTAVRFAGWLLISETFER